MATIGTSGSGTIDQPVTDVWKFIADPALLHHWVKDIEPGGEWIDGGSDDVVGSQYRVDYSYGRKTNEIVFEVTASETPTRFAVNTLSGPYPITADYVLTSSADGSSTRVDFEMIARSDSSFTAAMFVLTGWFAKWFMKRQLNKELADLQAVMGSKQVAS
ncbi:MAG: hypothetical protein HOF01_08295 [Chloroflexi bacterium]|jgi:uncharacterized protein YndB with AHSA1/START domain|nr:hypothetical protein [Chloroflexota bacterium]